MSEPNAATVTPAPPDHWHWCAVGLFGVVQMLARLNESNELHPKAETLDSLRTVRNQLNQIIDGQARKAAEPK